MKQKSIQLSKKSKFWQKFCIIGATIILVISVAVSGIVLFQRYYYSLFWVNGQSMYPTLNKDAKYKDGTLVGRKSNGTLAGRYDVDYGFMDSHQNTIDRLGRFDIIIFKTSEMKISYNIKRIIALPGETFYITSNTTDSTKNGKLYIFDREKEEYNFIEQPLSETEVQEGNYPIAYSLPTTLRDDEYFVMGDNRPLNNSCDSRSSGPIKKELILGKAIGINGLARLSENESPSPIEVYHHWPRFL